MTREALKSKSGAAIAAGNIAASTGVGAGAGALIGLGVGTIVPAIGNAIGAGVGAAIGATAGLITGIVSSASVGSSSEREREAIEKIAEAQKTQGNKSGLSEDEYKEYVKSLGITDTKLIDSLAKNRKEVENLAKEINLNTDATIALNK
jgi:hypothetical protein